MAKLHYADAGWTVYPFSGSNPPFKTAKSVAHSFHTAQRIIIQVRIEVNSTVMCGFYYYPRCHIYLSKGVVIRTMRLNLKALWVFCCWVVNLTAFATSRFPTRWAFHVWNNLVVIITVVVAVVVDGFVIAKLTIHFGFKITPVLAYNTLDFHNLLLIRVCFECISVNSQTLFDKAEYVGFDGVEIL